MSGLPDVTPISWRWKCGPYDLSSCDAVSPENKDRIEAILMLCTALTDENGKLVMFRMPPSLALAIIALIDQNQLRPQEFAASICDATHNRLATARGSV